MYSLRASGYLEPKQRQMAALRKEKFYKAMQLILLALVLECVIGAAYQSKSPLYANCNCDHNDSILDFQVPRLKNDIEESTFDTMGDLMKGRWIMLINTATF